MNKMQASIDGMNIQQQNDRSESQMTLGDMIKALESLPDVAKIEGLGDFNSYRGYYCDLAFEPQEGKRLVIDILKQCRSAMGVPFMGFKGGEFVMGAQTPLWLADYGCCGYKIIAIGEGGKIETAMDD